MNRILYEQRCKCSRTRKLTTISEGRPFKYPNPEFDEILSETFQVKYEKRLSSTTKLILNSFQNKYIHYAIDDILYFLKLNSLERDNLLEILYSLMISLQNSFSVNFFDIWIGEVHIDEIGKVNKFLNTDSQISGQLTYIKIQLFYTTSLPVKKQEPLW